VRRTWGWIWIGLLVLVPTLLLAAFALEASGSSGSPPLHLIGTLPSVEGRHPPAPDWEMEVLQQLPPAPPEYDPFATNFSWNDLRGLDLSSSGEYLRRYASFSTRTQWPRKMPADFDPARILEEGKNPGLGVRQLHRQGVTGEGVRVAILDQTLLREHQEYASQISRYFEVGQVERRANLSGPTMASLVAGRSVGVAPGAMVDYYAVQMVTDWQTSKRTLLYAAEVIQRILDENQHLLPQDRVRVIAIQSGASPGIEGHEEILRAYERAWQEGVLVLNTDFGGRNTFGFIGLGRAPGTDPDDPAQYRPGARWENQILARGSWIGVPMDSRTTAAPTGPNDYVFYRMGGEGWSVAYVTGLYAMACQVRPDIAPELFLRLADETAQQVTYERNGFSYTLIPVINPAALIDAVSRLPGK
jgi:hypothetical protein